ncbi:O-antigen/teichoic acid export membrane protein [Geodermatophilus tzadiensis]|uniref:O-antigen/teichoic acid export membrane protein n=1 Tax=Geodermatophilus tzadiensis TaxID=1137988 RepID=A0A2T0U1V1_9ACTN|nr:O-antigen/teichoic acid export membrane protein [Geodermatophilus tzadiensis]
MTAPEAAAGPAPGSSSGVGASGLGLVAVAIVGSGLFTYAYLALVARSVPVEDYGWFGSYWSLALVLGFGVFQPIELELARLVHLRPPGAPLPRGAVACLAALTTGSTAVVLLAAGLLVPALGGESGFLFALLCVCLVSAGQFLLRGLLLGSGRLGLHGAVLLVDSGLRVVLALGLALLAPSAGGVVYAWTLVAAMALAHLPLLGWVLLRRRTRRVPRPADDPSAGELAGAVGHLLTGSLAAQVVLNAAPVLVSVLAAPGEDADAARFVASFTLVRLPLFVAVPLQSALIPLLTRLQSEGDDARLRRTVVRGCALVGGLAVLAALAGWLLGRPVVALVFGERYALEGGAIALLAVGSVLHLGLLVASQALVAAARHRRVAVVWLSGLAASAVALAAVPDLVLRCAAAFTVGSGVALLVAAVSLLRAGRETPAPAAPSSREEPRHAPHA